MKINFIIPFKRLSGGIRVVYIYANYLVSQGHDVCCYLPAISYKGKDQSVGLRLRASISNTVKKESWFECEFPVKVVPRINNFFIRNADVSIATAWQTAYDVAKLSNKKGRKVYLIQDYETFNGSKEDVEGTYKLGLHTVVVSEKLKEILNKFTDDVILINNGISEDEFIRKSKPTHLDFRVLLMYNEAPFKGSKEGVEIIRNLQKKHPDVRGMIFGRSIPQNLKGEFFCEELPKRKDLLNMYRNADVYLFTSHREAWGLPVVEAMANKCAVIGRKVGALAELGTSKNSMLVTDNEEMYQSLLKLYNDRQLLHEIQNNGYESVQYLSWNNSCEKFLKYLRKIEG